jgi:hypothetical protein
MTLRVQGVASVVRAAASVNLSADATSARLAALNEDGLTVERTGRVAGYSLTPQGVEVLEKLLAAEGLRGDTELTDCYEWFLLVNQRVLEVSTQWQVRKDGGVETANDHSDPDYDSSVIDRLSELHDRAKVSLDKISKCAPRFATYRARLDCCIDRLQQGDASAFTALMAESYHTVWFELHQDLLLTLGIEREA